MYLRQVYKVHLKQQTLQSDNYTTAQPARIFRGVDKDKNRKGELFGLENLLKFKDGSFMESLWKATVAVPKKGIGDAYIAGDLAGAMQDVSADLIENGFEDEDLETADIDESRDSDNEELKGFNHEDILREDRGDAAVREGDEGYDEEMGAGSQLVDLACEEIDDFEIESKGGVVPENSVDAEATLLANVGKTVGLKPIVQRAAMEEKFATLKAALGGEEAKNFCESSAQHIKLKVNKDSAGTKHSDTLLPASNTSKKLANGSSKKKDNMKYVPTGSDQNTTKATTAQIRSKESAKKKATSFSSKSMLYIPSYLRDKK